MNAPLTRILTARRIRLAIARQELGLMERNAQAALAGQRNYVAELSRTVDDRSAEQVRRDVERRAKAPLLLIA